MDDNFHRMFRIPVGVVEGLSIQDVNQLRILLGSLGVEVEFDPRMRTSVWFFQTRTGVEDIAGILLVLRCGEKGINEKG